MTRPSADDTMLAIAVLWSKRSTCTRLATGATISTFDGHVISSGFNGAPRGADHCTEVGCLIEGGHCVRAIHAEANAIIQAARIGTSVDGGILYCTHRPCVRCTLTIIQAGIDRVIYARPYNSDGLADHVADLFKAAGVTCVQGTNLTVKVEG